MRESKPKIKRETSWKHCRIKVPSIIKYASANKYIKIKLKEYPDIKYVIFEGDTCLETKKPSITYTLKDKNDNEIHCIISKKNHAILRFDSFNKAKIDFCKKYKYYKKN